MSQWTEKAIEEAVAVIHKRAMTDPAFRRLCLENPAGAVKEATGMELPPDFKLRFVDNAGAHLTFVLPDMMTADELAEAELEQVAGGISNSLFTGGVTLMPFFPEQELLRRSRNK